MKTERLDAPISRHLLANVLGRSWAFLSTFLFVPVYVHLLGIENFGVIALFLVVGGLLAFLDLGLSPTLARELHDQARGTREKASLLFTYEIAFASIVGAVVLSALVVPTAWFSVLLTSEDLSRPEVSSSIRLVFVAAAVQLLFNFYVAGLMGVEEQIKGNVIIVVAGVVRSGIVVGPLWVFPLPAVYLLWQVVFVLVFSGIARYLLYKAIARDMAAAERVFAIQTIMDNLSFTRGMFLISMIAAINTQVDKLLISKLSGMAALSEYLLVSTFAQLLVFVVSPVTIAMLPRFVRSASLGDTEAVRYLFLVTHKLVAATVCAAVGCMVFFGPYLISIWTVGNVEADSIGAYATLLVIGYASLALQTVPHCVAIANKDLKWILFLGGASVLFTLPVYWYLINQFGVVGAAITWLTLQLIIYPLYVGWVNKRFIGVASLWRDVLLPTVFVPLLVALAIGYFTSHFLLGADHIAINMVIIGVASILSLCCCLCITVRPADLDFLFGSIDGQIQ